MDLSDIEQRTGLRGKKQQDGWLKLNHINNYTKCKWSKNFG